MMLLQNIIWYSLKTNLCQLSHEIEEIRLSMNKPHPK